MKTSSQLFAPRSGARSALSAWRPSVEAAVPGVSAGRRVDVQMKLDVLLQTVAAALRTRLEDALRLGLCRQTRGEREEGRSD